MNTALAFNTATSAQPAILQLAQHAFASHQKGIATGDWTDLLALMSEEVEFQAPSPYIPSGVVYGKQKITAILQKVSEDLNVRAALTLLYPIVVSETTVGFEFFANGQAANKPFSSRLVVFYEIEQGKIKCLREYTGQRHQNVQAILQAMQTAG
ncbi:nuclear transport factor 2 family protein [Stenomitos frigidus]|uniref:nuclear transport factor 2 family protein n=1 Tax=Stenomitos frigidus TaxID=1886765 RepID=UPI0011B29D89|nr:nuclear transport factor 2 family protein [Stenomitos frigidus]